MEIKENSCLEPFCYFLLSLTMNFKTKTLLLLTFSVVIMACKTSSAELPAKRPVDLNVNYHLDGGMNDYSVDIKIDADSCRYRQRKDGKVIEKSIKLTVAELDSVYLIFRKNEFDKIRYITEKGEVYDRGGISITVGFENKNITVSDAQSSFVKEEWFVQWKTICEELDAMIRKGALV